MIKNFETIKKEGIFLASSLIALAGRTAPKARGIDNLEIIIIDGKDIKSIQLAMKSLGEKESRPSFIRDLANLDKTECIIIAGTKINSIGLNCSFCGFKTCLELEKTGGVCVYNSMDLGIALGSMVSSASNHKIDNRLMFSIGKAALEMGLFSKDVKIAIGIPLSATGKSPFFDR